jgi:hypothetical protein
MIMSIQEFFEKVALPAIRDLSPEEKAEFREVWRSQIAERETTARSDRWFLRSVGIDPDGD